MTQVIAGQNPRPSRNFPRSPNFDTANGGKDSPQKIHHRPIRQIGHIFFLSHLEREPEQYSTLNPLKTKTPGTHCRCAKHIIQSTRRGNRKGRGRACGGQFPRVSENIYQAGGVNRMGQGRVCGGQSLENKNPRDPITGPRGFV